MKNGIAALWCLLVLGAMPVTPALAFTKESLVWKKCTACHEPAGGRIARVEEIRTTPEEWIVIVDRMARLHGMDLAKGEMDQLLKELCATQILTPAELAEIDAGLLTDELPISAYLDKGFDSWVTGSSR